MLIAAQRVSTADRIVKRLLCMANRSAIEQSLFLSNLEQEKTNPTSTQPEQLLRSTTAECS